MRHELLILCALDVDSFMKRTEYTYSNIMRSGGIEMKIIYYFFFFTLRRTTLKDLNSMAYMDVVKEKLDRFFQIFFCCCYCRYTKKKNVPAIVCVMKKVEQRKERKRERPREKEKSNIMYKRFSNPNQKQNAKMMMILKKNKQLVGWRGSQESKSAKPIPSINFTCLDGFVLSSIFSCFFARS